MDNQSQMKFLCRYVRALFFVFALGVSIPSLSGPLEDATATLDRGDYAAALPLLRDLAERGNAAAQYDLGSMYATGRGVPKDYGAAVQWIRKAAEQGLAVAQYDLGIMYRDGLGVAKDDVEAVKWYRKAAEQGLALAQHNLAFRYERGQGIGKDEAAAAEWYRKAAEQGRANSQYNLGIMYAEGRGVSQNLVDAYEWLSISAQGLQGAQKDQVISRRDQLAKTMTRDQIEQAQQLAREWTPGGPPTFPYRVFDPSQVAMGEASAVAGGQRVDMGSYILSAPGGQGWKVQTDQANGVVMFTRLIPRGMSKEFDTISVGNRPLNPGMENQTEDEIFAAIESFEEKNMRARGATRSYTLGDVKKETTMVGDKQLHVMNYVITDLSRGTQVEMKNAHYIYLPPDFKQAHQVYFFHIAQAQRVGDVAFETDLSQILPVIGSFQSK